MMTYIYQNNYFVAFVIPDNADIHIDVTLKKICSPLDTLCSKGWVGRVFSQKLQLVFKLFLFLDSQILKVLLKRGVKVNAYAIIQPPVYQKEHPHCRKQVVLQMQFLLLHR